MTSKKAFTLGISVIFGFAIALTTRASLLMFAPDFTYYRIGPVWHPGLYIPGGEKEYFGKKIIGMSGIPFPAYTSCTLGYHGENISPACTDYFVGNFSVIFNTAFWSLLLYGCSYFIMKRKEKNAL